VLFVLGGSDHGRGDLRVRQPECHGLQPRHPALARTDLRQLSVHPGTRIFKTYTYIYIYIYIYMYRDRARVIREEASQSTLQ
jgi:hypothetical protein